MQNFEFLLSRSDSLGAALEGAVQVLKDPAGKYFNNDYRVQTMILLPEVVTASNGLVSAANPSQKMIINLVIVLVEDVLDTVIKNLEKSGLVDQLIQAMEKMRETDREVMPGMTGPKAQA